MALTFQQLQQRIEASFNADKAAGLDSLFQYVVPDGSNFYLHISAGRCEFFAGDCGRDADVYINIDWGTLEELLLGTVSGMQAFMFGRIKVKGSLVLASQLIEIFETKD